MSVKEPLSLTALHEVPSKFCVNLKTDLERLIHCFEKEMKSLNCELEVISPRKRGKGKGKKAVNDYSINIEEFSSTKKNIFDKMMKYLGELEDKWNEDFNKLRNQISSSMQDCLTDIQLSIKVVEEVEVEDSESNSSSDEKEILSKALPSKRSKHHLAAASSKNKKTDWRPLLSVVEEAPEKSGVYEIKVWRAKKCAYIGHCENLLKRLSLHREKASTGQKHLDQFISRNNDDIVVRYDTFPSAHAAKMEEKRRLKSFLEKYKNLPSYNYKL